jgi:glycosyltransferase involved in cell wall biosynthesis
MNRDRRLKIAVLNRHFGARFGGAERYSVALVEQLAARHEIHVFAQEIEHDWPGVSYHRISRPLPKPRWVNQLWFAASTWWLTRKGFDVVHSHENTWHGQIQTVHVRPFRVGVFHGRSGLLRALKWLNILTSPRLIFYWLLEASRFRVMPKRCIVASSGSVRDEILSGYPRAAAMLSVIPPGVDIPAAQPDRVGQRRRLGLPADVKLALFVGNDYEKKGLPALLAALANLPSLHLAVVGNGAHIPAFRKRAESLDIADRVHFLGSLSNVTPAYEAADLLVHPTTEDTYAMVVLEALAHGLPVVVSAPAYCGISADLSDGSDALIVKNPRDAAEISICIGHILADPILARRLVEAGRRFASGCDWAVMASRLDGLYRQASRSPQS